MKTLDELRQEINAIDCDLAKVLQDRLSVAQAIAAYKIENGIQILQSDREAEIYRNFLGNFDKDLEWLARAIYGTVLRSSRALQFHDQAEKDVCDSMVKLVKNAPQTLAPVYTVCYQGVPGAWSHSAAKKLYPNAETISVLTFEEIFQAVSDGRAQAGVLPLDTSTAGTVDDVYDLLIRHDCMIQSASAYPIRHCLLAVPGATRATVKSVHSHPQGLAQCSRYIKAHRYLPILESNTAVAAKKIAESGATSMAAIAPRDTAKHYGLSLLEEGINDSECNQTRFVSITKNFSVPKDANRISLAFRLPNQSGALANVIGLFSYHGINLLKISSRPIPNQPWEYCFYLDCAIDGLNTNVFGLLNQLDAELGWVKLLGCYPEQTL